jgi:hypothetical protein
MTSMRQGTQACLGRVLWCYHTVNVSPASCVRNPERGLQASGLSSTTESAYQSYSPNSNPTALEFFNLSVILAYVLGEPHAHGRIGTWFSGRLP